MLRLFVALEVPEAQKLSIEHAIEPLRLQLPAARWTARESWHVTLKFLGSTHEEQLGAVSDAVRAVGAAAASGATWLTGMGVFPRPRQARVVWVGLDDHEGRLAGLAARLDTALEPLGFAKESRPWRPHLTVARFKVPVAVDLAPAGAMSADPFPCREIVLFRSHLRPQGAVYEPLGRFPLGP